MTLMVLVSALAGASVFAGLALVVPGRSRITVEVGRIDAARRGDMAAAYRSTAEHGRSLTDLRERLGARITAALARRGFAMTSTRQDLELLGRSLEGFVATKVLTAVYGALLVLGVSAALTVAGIGVPPALALGLMLLLAVGFFVLPDLGVRSSAADRRRDFRRALGSFLDLVAMSMAGGRGVPEALPAAARIGTGWTFTLLQTTLERGRVLGQPPWVALGELGERIGLEDLRTLASSLSLVANDGAKIRDTLSARATTLRRRQLTDAEGKANERDQSMRVAQIVIGFGFIVFLGYPAVVNVLSV